MRMSHKPKRTRRQGVHPKGGSVPSCAGSEHALRTRQPLQMTRERDQQPVQGRMAQLRLRPDPITSPCVPAARSITAMVRRGDCTGRRSGISSDRDRSAGNTFPAHPENTPVTNDGHPGSPHRSTARAGSPRARRLTRSERTPTASGALAADSKAAEGQGRTRHAAAGATGDDGTARAHVCPAPGPSAPPGCSPRSATATLASPTRNR